MTNIQLKLMKKWGMTIIASVLVLSMLVACSDQQKKDVKVILDWYPNAVHSFFYQALENGYFTEEGLDVSFEPPAETNDPLKLVAAGKVPFAVSYQNQIVTARSEKLPVVSVAAIVRKPLTQLMVSEASGITRPKDLEGRKIGYSSIELYRTFVETMVKNDGGDPKKVEFIDIGWDLIPAMINKRVDGIMGGFINHEKPILADKGMNIRIIEGVKYGLVDYYELVLVTNEKMLEEDRETVEGFVRAMRKGYADMVTNPQKSLDLLLTKQRKEFPLKADIEKQSLDMLLPLMDAGKQPYGYQSEQSWKEAAKWMYDNGAIEKPIEANEAFINID
jgi:putative hydroxymethylpyrimidine transport system substrate-binding protein